MIQLKDGAQVVVEADSYEEALTLLKYQDRDNMIVYPKDDGSEVHVRLKDEDGEFTEVRVYTVEQT